jgi:hypothetical protein
VLEIALVSFISRLGWGWSVRDKMYELAADPRIDESRWLTGTIAC